MAAKMVLSEDEALEFVAFLVTAARTQVDEAAEYGSLRLLTAAGRLAELIAERVSPETRTFLTGPLKQIPDLAVRTADPAGYVAALDGVCRAVGEHLVTRSGLEEVLKAARWAPSAGNRRLHRFIAIQDPLTLKLLRMVTPGMFQRPAAIVVICIDRAKAESFGMRPNAKGLFNDVGTAAQTMLLAAPTQPRGMPSRGPVTWQSLTQWERFSSSG